MQLNAGGIEWHDSYSVIAADKVPCYLCGTRVDFIQPQIVTGFLHFDCLIEAIEKGSIFKGL